MTPDENALMTELGISTTGMLSFALCMDDLLRSLKEGESVKVYFRDAYRRRIVHKLAERYVGMVHETIRPDPEELKSRSLGSWAQEELLKRGFVKRGRNGCHPCCCGWEVIAIKVPMVLKATVPISKPGLRDLLCKGKSAIPASERRLEVVPCTQPVPKLNSDCINHICMFLPLKDVLQAMLVSKSWNSAIKKSSVLWKHLVASVVAAKDSLDSFSAHEDASGTADYFRQEALRLRGQFCRRDGVCRSAPRHMHLN